MGKSSMVTDMYKDAVLIVLQLWKRQKKKKKNKTSVTKY